MKNIFLNYFPILITAYYSWKMGYVKPDPTVYQPILEENSLQSNNCLYVDDTEENLHVAKSMGIHCSGVTHFPELLQLLSSNK